MNLLNNLVSRLTLLDVAIGPSFSGSFDGDSIDPITRVILIVVLVLFLVFIGYLIWKSLQNKNK